MRDPSDDPSHQEWPTWTSHNQSAQSLKQVTVFKEPSKTLNTQILFYNSLR